jgi:integrase/recombinase XerD
MRNLSDNEVRQLLAAIDGRHPAAARDEALLVFLLHTGLRPSELLGLNVENVAVEGRARETLDLPSAIAKCGLGRLVALNSAARAAVERLLAYNKAQGWSVAPSAPLAYSTTGNRLCIRMLQYIVSGLRKRAKLDVQATPHSLRHTNLTNLLEACGNTRLVQVHGGHLRLSSVEVYTRPSREAMAAASEKLVRRG